MPERRDKVDAVRRAAVDAERRRGSELAEEVRRIAENRDDAAERRAAMADMESVTAGWPE
jgi:HEAT repeat protein